MTKKNYSSYSFRFILFIFLGALFLLPFILAAFISTPDNKAVFQSKAQTAGGGIDAIQQEINSAKDGATITIPAGQYTGATAVPLNIGGGIAVTTSRGAADTCFLRIENKKNIVVKGQGVVLFGEGHDKPDASPYNTRAGICVINSTVTFEGLHIKEFQTRCMVVYNSTIVYRNGIVDGCDGGGVSLLGNSSGLFVNNMFAELNVGGVMLWQNSQAKIVNNIFYNAAVLYFYHPGTNDQARADIINNIFSEIKSDIAQVGWWQATPEELKMSRLSYNIIYRVADQTCDPKFQLWCDDFPGKVLSDPLYAEPVTDPRGIAAWANFGFKEGSPALGVGDPSIPGPKNLGNAGGPCVEPNSSTCTSFIASNTPKPYEEPAPTSAESDNSANDMNISFPDQGNQQPIIPTVETTIGPRPTSIQNNVFNNTKNTQTFLIVENKNSNKQLTLKGINISDESEKIDTQIPPGQTSKVEIQKCATDGNLNGGILYLFSDDSANTLHFKNFSIDCSKQQTIRIE